MWSKIAEKGVLDVLRSKIRPEKLKIILVIACMIRMQERFVKKCLQFW